MARNIFINYRRDDDAGFTQALYSRLEQTFPAESLFMDVDNIAPGADFVQVLNDEVARCDVVIAVIGKNWLSVIDETGGRRLDNPEDFVRIEIESALAQKKRVIPVLVNDARMPRSTELPESMRAFARCNAVRLTHERFRADVAGLIKSLEQILGEADVARRDEEEKARRDAKAKEKADAERLKHKRLEQSRKAREVKTNRVETEPREPSSGLVGWIAGLPSVISWRIPIGVAAILLVGWILPGKIVILTDVGWGAGSLLYAAFGLFAVGAVFVLWRRTLDGTELALFWLAATTLYAVAAISIVKSLNVLASPSASVLNCVLPVLVAGLLLAIRRGRLNGLEFSVYWFGVALILYWAFLPVASQTEWVTFAWSYFNDTFGYRTAAITLACVVILSAVVIVAWRAALQRSKLSWPEVTVYLIGIANMLYVALPLVSAPAST